MYSFQALKEYRDTIYELCSSLQHETCEFFQTMERKGINVLNDTVENKIENINVIVDHYSCLEKIRSYIVANQSLDWYAQFSDELPQALVLTPQQVFETLVNRSKRTQEGIIKLSCEQHLMSCVLKSLEENDLTRFLSIIEDNKVDMTDLSKILSISDTIQIPDLDEDLFDLWCKSQKEKVKILENIIDPQAQSKPSTLSRSPLVRWWFKSLFTDDDLNNSNIFDLLPEMMIRFQKLYQDYEDVDEGKVIDEILAIWSTIAKGIIVCLFDLPKSIAQRIRAILSPFYFRPLIERYEQEWEDVQREQESYISRIEHRSDSITADEFSLPLDFFAQKNNSSSFHMSLHPDVVKAGVKKFEDLLKALAADGFVDKNVLPLLAYRLTGCGTPFGEDVITWHKEPKVIRYIIANMHDAGTNRVSSLDKYFIDENGKNFLNTISAGQARSIKKLNIFRQIIKPYYGEVIKLP